jgi:UDP-N-acetyl-D-galactosamine dehydrogenase
MKEETKYKITVVGLGYVGLPLAIEFSNVYDVVGFDVNQQRVDQLNNGIDLTLEVDVEKLINAKNLIITSNEGDISDSNIYIITVPTPVDRFNNPDLAAIKIATHTVSKYLKKGDIVIYESTVYPGVTEEICVGLLESGSGLLYNKHFFCGYSPERINPGDKFHTLTKIKKITSGSNNETALIVDELYGNIISAGTFMASSIKVAEAAKVIENAQRDINIAFVNELTKIFDLINIDIHEVLEAASTKWNFLNFKPGLVGGHCIGVDPFYLAHKAKEVGYHPEIILAGRRLNDSMGPYVANKFIKLLIQNDVKVKGAKILVLGITFKENCPDIRNSRVIDVINELESFGIDVSVYDPWANKVEVLKEYKIKMVEDIKNISSFVGILIAVGHDKFREIEFGFSQLYYDVKGIYNKQERRGKLS